MFSQLRFEPIGERQQVMCVIHRVLEHPHGEGTSRPICLLRTLAEVNIEMSLYQSGQTKIADPEQACGNHRVENPACRKVQTAAKQSQIEIRAVQNNFLAFQRSG